ncbi:hypothetical protein FGB62_35g01 [Gracilaria domingensis]|nr:hypothetical protein FGB62_35g01 [Gracilaria domingensis]
MSIPDVPPCPEVPEDVPELPDMATDKTEAARKKLEKQTQRDANIKPRKKGKRQHSSLFGKRASSSAANVSSDTSESVEEEPKAPEDPAPLDILRTARISKKMFEGEITHKYAPVSFTPFGQDWATDSFALIHNAIKAEIRDLQNMAYVMQKRKMLLTMTHIEIFYEWWTDFFQFVDVAITIEEEVYYGWVGSKDSLREADRVQGEVPAVPAGWRAAGGAAGAGQRKLGRLQPQPGAAGKVDAGPHDEALGAVAPAHEGPDFVQGVEDGDYARALQPGKAVRGRDHGRGGQRGRAGDRGGHGHQRGDEGAHRQQQELGAGAAERERRGGGQVIAT